MKGAVGETPAKIYRRIGRQLTARIKDALKQ